MGADGLKTACMSSDKGHIGEIFLHNRRDHGRQTPGVGAGFYPQVEVGHPGGICQRRIKYDHGACRVFGYVIKHLACLRKAMGLPGIFAYKNGNFRVVEITVGAATAEHFSGHPELTGFLLGKRVGLIPYTQCSGQGSAVECP